jgi:phospholipid/cholesterol/gamma-HCH transport system substrate-binding protein
MFSYKTAGIKSSAHNYNLKAKFAAADGINAGSDIRISGVKVGHIDKITLDRNSYFAIAELSIDRTVILPKDSSAKIVSDGLLGSKYISLVPGADEVNLTNGEEIKFTQSTINIEALISKFMFNAGDKKKDE